jgi:Uma2 family endonuclease
LLSHDDDETVVVMGGRVMSEQPTQWGKLPPNGSRLTTAQYLQTVESMRVQELVYGTLRVEEPSPLVRHQELLLELAILMRVHVGRHKLGTVIIAPQDVILDPAQALIVQPDLMFISNWRNHIITDHIWGAPDLVVEVMSPHPRIGKLDERIGWFTHYGVRECWLIHQLSKEIEVLKLQEHGSDARRTFRGVETIESSVLPDFGISVAVLECWG